MEFNIFIVEKRKSLGYSQKDVAEKLGVSVPTISNWENKNRYPDLFILGEMAKLYELDLESLLLCRDEKRNNFDNENSFNFADFSSYLKKLRRSKNITLTQLSELPGISYQTISKWENQQSLPHIETFLKLCEILKENVQEVYYGKKLIVEEFKNAEIPKRKNKKFDFLAVALSIFVLISLTLSISLPLTLSGTDSAPSGDTPTQTPTNPTTIKEKLEVTFDFDNPVEDVVVLVERGKCVNKYDPKLEGYETKYFLGEEEFDFSTPIYTDITINCEFEIYKYLVRFYGEDNLILKEEVVEHGKSATAPNVSTSDSLNEFLGWNKDFSCVTSDLDVYAIFGRIAVDITFDANGGTCDIDYIIDYDPSMFYDLPIPYKKGYKFVCWELNGVPFTSDMDVYTPITLVARYEAQEFKINFDANGGTCTFTSIKVKYDEQVTLPKAYKDNNKFMSWLYNGERIEQSFKYQYDFDITLVASYLLTTNDYEYEIVNNEAHLIKYLGNETNIYLPSIIKGHTVTAISDFAFEDVIDVIESIYFHSSIKDVHQGLLDGAESLKVLGFTGQSKFYISKLFNTIPINFDTIEIYGNELFEGIKPSMLSNNSNKKFKVFISNCKENESSIEDPNDYIEEIIVYPKLKKANFNERKSLKRVELIQTFGSDVSFNECTLLSEVIIHNQGSEIPSQCFQSTDSLKNYVINDTVKIIRSYAFYCSALRTITIPNSITDIEYGAFEIMDHLKSVYYNGTIDEWLSINFAHKGSNPLYSNENVKLYLNGVLCNDPRAYE